MPKSAWRFLHGFLTCTQLKGHWLCLLADRTNGRAYATVLRLSVVCRLSTSVTLCIVAKRCVVVVEQKLLLRAYRKLYMRNRLVLK